MWELKEFPFPNMRSCTFLLPCSPNTGSVDDIFLSSAAPAIDEVIIRTMHEVGLSGYFGIICAMLIKIILRTFSGTIFGVLKTFAGNRFVTEFEAKANSQKRVRTLETNTTAF